MAFVAKKAKHVFNNNIYECGQSATLIPGIPTRIPLPLPH